MAWYNNTDRVHHIGPGPFDIELDPGDECVHHGIYYCKVCGREIALPQGHKAPPQNHHQHALLGAIRWKLLVMCDGRSDAERK